MGRAICSLVTIYLSIRITKNPIKIASNRCPIYSECQSTPSPTSPKHSQEMDAWGEGIQDMTTDQSKPYAMMLASSKLYQDCERYLNKKVWDGIKMSCTFEIDRPRTREPPKRIIVDYNETYYEPHPSLVLCSHHPWYSGLTHLCYVVLDTPCSHRPWYSVFIPSLVLRDHTVLGTQCSHHP